MRYCDCPHSQVRDAAHVSVTSFVAMTKYQTKATQGRKSWVWLTGREGAVYPDGDTVAAGP